MKNKLSPLHFSSEAGLIRIKFGTTIHVSTLPLSSLYSTYIKKEYRQGGTKDLV